MNSAAICTIGDEILIGQIVDTNSSAISQALNRIGVKVETMVSIKDDRAEIIDNLRRLCDKYNVVIVTGGLGPTRDDITKDALRELSGSKSYIENEAQLEIVREFARRRGMELLDLNRLQASVPDSCTVLTNIKGTAPGMFFKIKSSNDFGESLLFSLPGVPYEMEYLLPKVINHLNESLKLEGIFHKTIMTFGIPESVLAKKIEHWELDLPEYIKLAYLPNPLTGIRLRLSVYGDKSVGCNKEIDERVRSLSDLLGEHIYGYEESTLQDEVFKLLKEKGKTLSIAESCTGGKILSLFTAIPGASDILRGGVVAYSNELKKDLLSVSDSTLVKYGAVSRECAAEMAKGVHEISKSDYSISVTGIAGPDGGSDEKPVGSVWIGFYDGVTNSERNFISTGDRIRNIERFSAEAINFLRLQLIDN